MPEWEGLGVAPDILRALGDQGFSKPTPIQSLSIPPALLYHRDIIGAAETGSGKTLAFGIPIIQHIEAYKKRKAEQSPSDKESDLESQGYPLLALIMAPTRELALQVKDHLVKAAKYTSVKVAAIVGGMAAPKQQRLLKQRPEIVVATPGRLWELISQQEEHVSNIQLLRYLVIDEADRMVEQGHYEELSSILELIHLKKSGNMEVDQEDAERPSNSSKTPEKARLQKFIFSATLTLPKSFKKRGREKTVSKGELLASLMDKIHLERKRSKVIDVTSSRGTVETLTEAKITCTKEDKDVYLYYFLLKYPGRTLVFANTIDCVRRLTSILRLVQLNPLPLHASMQQRQRLKNLDRFKASNTGLLLATDVAARGLDIANIEHVIHYQVPKDPEVYVHRSGRTARASHEGLSVVLVGPEDLAHYRKTMKTLNNGEDLGSFPVDVSYLPGIRNRLSIARQIDKEELKVSKKKSSNSWILNSAKAMDIEVDEDLLEDLGDSHDQKVQRTKLAHLKASLNKQLKSPLVPLGFSGKYPTKTGKLVMPGIQGQCPDDESPRAVTDVTRNKKRKKR
ncbi:predicted protein [Nematostella vectensis]|uniref:ATP-dependent RNA helicase n=1 Tax=Nematostella vectensis TaxID=45351 RepID=A7RKF5_NEMVE|nr:predicted protein [Nematostella vectensis]|eukprot:XP_001640301.1 predicted protein [Nematostella vectensis]